LGEGKKTGAPQSPLAGKLFDELGEPLYVQGAAKGERRYRYYVSKALVRGASETTENGWRISAPEIERAVSTAAQAMLRDRAAIALALEEANIDADQLAAVLKSAQFSIERLRSGSEGASAMGELVDRVELGREGIKISLRISPGEAVGGSIHADLSLARFVPMEIKQRGVEAKIVLEGDQTASRVDLPLLKAVARARRWVNDLLSGAVPSVDALAKREAVDHRSVRRMIRLGFLSPRIVEAIAEGRQPPEMTVIALARRLDLPILWGAQEEALEIC
jgi:site-specific DNA recombinase